MSISLNKAGEFILPLSRSDIKVIPKTNLRSSGEGKSISLSLCV